MFGRALAIGAVVTLVAGCGGSSSSSSSQAVTLSISGSNGNLNAVACGKQEAFFGYAAPASIKYSGTVSPAPGGRWKVKIKLKRCVGSSFVDADAQKIVGQPSGAFDGVFPVPARGSYSLRATVEGGGRHQSQKLYLQVR